MGGESQQLLTDDDRRAHLHKLFGHRVKSLAQLSLPGLEDYNNLGTDEGLKTTGYAMCRQIGFKPNGLHIEYADQPLPHGYLINRSVKTISIDPQFISHPYSAGAVLAMGVAAYAVEHFGHETPGRSFIEFVTIETGLGLWIVNALRPRLSLKQKLYHVIDSSWFHKEGVQLEAYSQKQYVERIVSFAHENHIATDIYLPHILGRVRYLFPPFIREQSGRHLPESPAILAHRKSANTLWTKVILIATIAACGIVFGVYALASHDKPVNPEIARLQNSINELKRAHADCQREAADQQNTYDPNDLFLTRQIDDTKSRCESLRNQYNFTVDEYQKVLE